MLVMTMGYMSEFLRQEVPKTGKTMPAYYRRALLVSEAVLACYFLISIVLILLTTGKLEWAPITVLIATGLCLAGINKMNPRINLACFTSIILIWLTWFVHIFGWSAGSPNILVPTLSLAYFNIYEPPLSKVGYFAGVVLFRIGLFTYSLRHIPTGSLSHTESIVFQVINSVIPLLMLTYSFMLFSSSIQASERELTINNQNLHREAGTDPLTGLPNRRAMLDAIEAYQKSSPDEAFSIAIADIDFFKRVNDTYGHNCGDYTLKELSALFLSRAGEAYKVCRWGGEEFCFFLPRMNLDQAGVIMHDLHFAVGKMPLHYEGIDFSITVTMGLAEYDFRSSLDKLMDEADHKLYMGKANGRNQVVI